MHRTLTTVLTLAAATAVTATTLARAGASSHDEYYELYGAGFADDGVYEDDWFFDYYELSASSVEASAPQAEPAEDAAPSEGDEDDDEEDDEGGAG